MKLMTIDPNSLKLSAPDNSIHPKGLACQAYFWNPDDYSSDAAPTIKLTLTEYADPGCQATYFLVRNPNSDILVEDELCEFN